MPLISFVCPNCHECVEIDSSFVDATCPKCGAILKINDETKLETFDELKKRALTYLKVENFSKLEELIPLFLKEYPDEFYTHFFSMCFYAKENLLNIAFKDYSLSEDEIEEDVKTRLYHLARYKYSNASLRVYTNISNIYPDRPGEDNVWLKAESQYDRNLRDLKLRKNLFEDIKIKFKEKLKELSKDDEEREIVNSIDLYLKHIDDQLLMLEDYNKAAQEFALKDYKKTKKITNKQVFAGSLITSINYAIAIILAIASISLCTNPDIYNEGLIKFSSIYLSSIYVISTLYFVYSRHLFSKNKYLFATLLIILAVVISTIGISASFISWKNAIHWSLLAYFPIMIIISIGSLCYFFYYLIKNIPSIKNKRHTYIGNYKALVRKNFKTNFSYSFNKVQD